MKTVVVFYMLQYTCLTDRLRFSGVEIFCYRIILPCWDDRKEISDFYRMIADRSERFCKETLYQKAKEDYERSDDPKKRFRYAPFLYVLEGRVIHDRDDLLSVRMEARWGRKGERELIDQSFDAHTWCIGEETMLPPRQIAERFGIRKISRRDLRESRGILVDRDRLFLCQSTGWKELMPPKTEEDKKEPEQECS